MIDAATRTITIHNDEARRDTSGAIVDAHEPCLRRFSDRFYLYGTNYRHHNGFTPDNLIVCYSSPDLLNWTNHDALFPPFPTGLTVAPDILWNEQTRRYVLWFINGGNYVVATAEQPTGPFRIHTRQADIRHKDAGCGDFALFQDADGSAYLIATLTFTKDRQQTDRRHCILIERLTDDYLGGTGATSATLGSNCEAPVLFRKDDTYYALFDTTCCYCPDGTGIQVHTASDPLGPYTYRGNVNRDLDADPRSIPSPGTEPGSGRPDATVPAQQRRVEWIQTIEGPVLLWIGDRWGSAPDGIKGHDATYWTPLAFEDDGMLAALRWRDSFTIRIDVPGAAEDGRSPAQPARKRR
ncbi:MAG: family 43 glycosylhydrolase [Planctomycetota bacterium]